MAATVRARLFSTSRGHLHLNFLARLEVNSATAAVVLARLSTTLPTPRSVFPQVFVYFRLCSIVHGMAYWNSPLFSNVLSVADNTCLTYTPTALTDLLCKCALSGTGTGSGS